MESGMSCGLSYLLHSNLTPSLRPSFNRDNTLASQPYTVPASSTLNRCVDNSPQITPLSID